VERRLFFIHTVQGSHPVRYAPVLRDLQLVPLETVIVVPFLSLTELAPHEEQFFSRMGKKIAVKKPETGKLLPCVPGHFSEHGPLAVDHLVVGEGKKKVFGEGIHYAEGYLVVLVFPVDGIPGDELQGVVHPSHVPLHAEPEAADEHRAGHHGPRRGLLGYGLNTGEGPVNLLVQLFQELYGLEVLSPPVGIGDPLSRLPGVIEVKHGRHRIHPQPVGMEAIEPEKRAAEQETPDFIPPVIEDPAPPVRMISFSRILVLVQARPVEPGQAVGIRGEMGRDPVEDNTDTLPVEYIHHVHEILRSPIAARGSEVPQGLVSPGTIKGMLHHGKQLHVSEPHGDSIVSQLVAQLPVGKGPESLRRISPP